LVVQRNRGIAVEGDVELAHRRRFRHAGSIECGTEVQ
jgi:hypothetical protein